MVQTQGEHVVRVAYDEVADTYAERFRTTEPELPLELAMVEHFASLLTGNRRVLDAGCGAGRMLPLLAELGCVAEGVDLSPEMVRRGRSDHPEFVTQVASITDLPFEDSSFDGVFSWYSTIHGDDEALATALSEFRRVLRPGGLVLVAFQSGSGVQDLSEAYRRQGHDVALVRYRRSAGEVVDALRGAGLSEVARLERQAAEHERDPQAVVVASC
jgi:SAM-dependent methyltransferase